MKKSAVRKMRGSIILPVAFSMLVGFILLGAVQLGYYFYMKLEMQNAADMAALSGVQLLSDGENSTEDCVKAQVAGKASARKNFERHGTLTDEQLLVTCGTWDEDIVGTRHFVAQAVNDKYNALHVTIKHNVLPFVPFSSAADIAVEAIAKSREPVAAFQVGAQLLDFDSEAPLGSLLGEVGLSVDNLTLLDSSGLANAKITPAGLLEALGLELEVDDLSALTPNDVLGLENVTLLDLIGVSLEVVGDSPLKVGLEALKSTLVSLNLGHLDIPLGSSQGQSGLFAFLGVGKGDDLLGPALGVELGLGDLLKTAIGIAYNKHALEGTRIELANQLITAELFVVSPPTIAIGPVGTSAHNAQVRLWLDIDTRNIPVLGPLLDALGTYLHLPIALDVVSGTGKLETLQCTRNPHSIDVLVESKIMNVCIGGMTEENIMSNKAGCETFLTDTVMFELFGVETIARKIHLPLLTDKQTLKNIEVGEQPVRATEPNSLALGTTIDSLITRLLNLLGDLFTESSTDSLREKMVESYLEYSKVNGFYNVDNITNLVLDGSGNPGEEAYLPPLLTENFVFDDAIPTTCVLYVCDPSLWKTGSFSEALHAYTSVPYGLLNIVGLPWMGNDFQNCAGLLSSLLSWNNCVKHNLLQLMAQHPAYVVPMGSEEMQAMLNGDPEDVSCNGALCILIKPVMILLKPVLDGLGGVLSGILADFLGLELGRTEVKALDIECDPAQLVY
ncbi:pilus assembly protein TadG-related protein [Advenella sp. RU8]|uniref:pilus assembly protein TadG-related protein n=1 Tax=Advenella sp. RU8 TaxID=3399575 RepID=UPI003AAD528A